MAKRITGNGRNGHFTSPRGGILDPITVNLTERMVANIASERMDWFLRQQGGDPRRDIDEECGYPKFLTIDDYWTMYDRNPVAKRVNNVLPRECWQTFPEVRESEDTHKDTEFERAFQDLDGQLQGENSWYESRDGKTSIFFDTCRRADEACGIGTFGIILIGLDDAAREEGGYRGLQDPVQGINEQNSVRVGREALGTNLNNTPGRWKLTVNAKETQGRKLLYLQPFDESVTQIVQFENNPTSPRYGKPVMYMVRVTSPGYQYGVYDAADTSGLPVGTYQVHWTRAVHVIDNKENSEVFGTSRLRAPWNCLYNIQKVLGADGEGFWKGAIMRTYLETHPQLGGDVDVNVQELRDMEENLENGLQRTGFLKGMTAHTVAPAVVDPTPHILANIEQICIMIPCPKRVFMGSERGELASSQDDAAWNDTLRARQNGHCTVRVAVPLIQRLIAVGVLPKPQRKYTLVWSDLESLSEDAAATVANKWTDVMNKYLSGNLMYFIDPLDFATRVMRMSEEEAVAVLSRSEKYIEFVNWIKETKKTTTFEPTEEWPGEEPPGGSADAGVAVGHVDAAAGEQPPQDGNNPADEKPFQAAKPQNA